MDLSVAASSLALSINNNTYTYDDTSSNPSAIFLTDVRSVWAYITVWTTVSVAVAFFVAGVQACKIHLKHEKNRWTSRFLWFFIPFCTTIVGAAIGFTEGTIPAALVAAISVSIPYPVGIDIGAGLGISEAIIIVYFHLGRADFIHK